MLGLGQISPRWCPWLKFAYNPLLFGQSLETQACSCVREEVWLFGAGSELTRLEGQSPRWMEFGSPQDWILEHPIPFVGAGLSRELPVVCVLHGPWHRDAQAGGPAPCWGAWREMWS